MSGPTENSLYLYELGRASLIKGRKRKKRDFERLAVRDKIKRFHPGSAASMMSQTERLNRWEETMAQIVHAPSDRMTNAGIAFVAASIVIGMVAGADAYAIGVGIALLILTGAMYFIR